MCIVENGAGEEQRTGLLARLKRSRAGHPRGRRTTTRLLNSYPALSVVEEFADPEEIEEAEALKEEDIDVEERDSQPQCCGRYWFFLLHWLSLFSPENVRGLHSLQLRFSSGYQDACITESHVQLLFPIPDS